MSTRGSFTSAVPTGWPGPVIMLKTPGGRSAWAISSLIRRLVNGASSDGLATTVQPAASAGRHLLRQQADQWCFHGVMRATTPTGA